MKRTKCGKLLEESASKSKCNQEMGIDNFTEQPILQYRPENT